MTQSDFLSFYPQFSSFTPAVVLQTYLRQANGRFSDFSEEDAEEARRLYVAHKLTLYSFTCLPPGAEPTPQTISSAGKAKSSRQVSGKKVGEVSVTYSTSSNMSTAVSSSLADLKETAFGIQLLTLIRQYSNSRYVP